MSIFAPIKNFADFVVYNLFSLNPDEKIARSLDYFIYSSIKILILIFIVGFVVGMIRESLTPARLKKVLKGKKSGMGNIISAILGVITPVESFSVVPIFLGFVETGIPVGIAFSFLVTAPMTNELAFVVLWGLYGAKMAWIYYASGIITGVSIGMLVNALKMDKYVNYVGENDTFENDRSRTISEIMSQAVSNSIQFFKSFWIYVVIGIAISAIAREFFPLKEFLQYIGWNNPFAVPLAVIIVICFYVNIMAVLPIIMVFIHNDLPMGTIMAFIMAVSATSVPEIMVLKRVLKTKLLVLYVFLLLSLIIFIGYFLNYVLYSGVNLFNTF